MWWKKDQIITWGDPIATFRWDDARDVDFKFLSVREIDPLKDRINNENNINMKNEFYIQ